ncbi:hypothetical protein [Kocuria turfanensis]|uniref:Uncharacterized protein n=1 Tax=Kocuria turfanensis TaxID=388357 RepID=A0A512IAJ5_9MICC|nr:hypothetical protein [Kocuria turfanensis]GEO94716.1 hypothetical protein KTU01_08390 [Kocuria turfanensis]
MSQPLTVTADEVRADPGRLAVLVPAADQIRFLADPDAFVSGFTPSDEFPDHSQISAAVRNTAAMDGGEVALVLLARWLRDVMPASVELLAGAGLCALVPVSPGGQEYRQAVGILEVRIGTAVALRIRQPDSYGDPTAHLLVDPGMESTWAWMGPHPTDDGAEVTGRVMDVSELILHDAVMRSGLRATALALLRTAAAQATTPGPREDHDPAMAVYSRWMVGVLDQYED